LGEDATANEEIVGGLAAQSILIKEARFLERLARVEEIVEAVFEPSELNTFSAVVRRAPRRADIL
jgi:hypothetical protein